MRARITGLQLKCKILTICLVLNLGRNVLDNFSRALQSATISACEGQRVVKRTVQALQVIRSDGDYNLFWKYLETRCSSLEVSTHAIPRRKRVPQRYQVGEAESEYPNTIQDHYRRIYFEVIDMLVTAISNRFDQQGFQMLRKLENLLINKAPTTDTIA